MRPRAVYRWAQVQGWSDREAGNWAAYCSGIDSADFEAGWSLKQVNDLLFLRWLRRTGRLTDD